MRKKFFSWLSLVVMASLIALFVSTFIALIAKSRLEMDTLLAGFSSCLLVYLWKNLSDKPKPKGK